MSQVPVKKKDWICDHPRRASVNSFGYGGTNVHVVIEEPPSRKTSVNGYGLSSTKRTKKKILLISANDEESLERLARSIADYIKESRISQTIENLTYTLGQRWSLLRYRIAVRGSTRQELEIILRSIKAKPIRITERPRICFVFTGQGAQWAKMGLELLSSFPTFHASMHAADKALAHLGSPWSLLGMTICLCVAMNRY